MDIWIIIALITLTYLVILGQFFLCFLLFKNLRLISTITELIIQQNEKVQDETLQECSNHKSL